MSDQYRENQILESLSKTDYLTLKDLKKQIFASESTIKRDIVKLEKKGLVIRSHGKIISASVFADKTIGLSFRETTEKTAKKKIANAAVNVCAKDGDVIFLDASSSAMFSVNCLTDLKDPIIITSGLKTSFLLSKTPLKFYVTGGKSINSSFSLVGQSAIETVNRFNADLCLLSCHGLSDQGYATDKSESENDLRRAMMSRSKRKVLLIDASKINKTCYNNLCHIGEFDDVFCDAVLPPEIMRSVKNFHLV
ncbi:MAG: DeoR/GlpR transcriptional regulator [Clostridia bacterium]|nr:DeoR/GlpR transcriptional regulator [Clostridia bacterium]